MDGSEKQPVRLSVFNQTFTLRVSGNPEQMLRAANEVDELLSTIAKSGNVDTVRVAILACLHLQDRIFSLQAELGDLRTSVTDRSRELSRLLDGIVPEQSS